MYTNVNKNKKSLDPLRAKKTFIRKIEDGPYTAVSAMRGKYCKLANLTRQSSQNISKITQIF